MAAVPKAAPEAANDNEPRRDRGAGRPVSLVERLLRELMYGS
jgi:hypothetical protein